MVHPDPTAAAFFDVDNTVMQGASIFHLARGLHRREFFTTREIASAAYYVTPLHLQPALRHLGWEAGSLPETERAMPFEDGMSLLLGEFSGRAEAVCPRAALRRVLDKAAAMGCKGRECSRGARNLGLTAPGRWRLHVKAERPWKPQQ